jgi:hypothetical protein
MSHSLTMPIVLDHLKVSSRNRLAAARRLASILDVPWSQTSVGPFCAVYVNDGLTLDFDQAENQQINTEHYCFRVGEQDFDDLIRRLTELGVPYRSLPHGPIDMKINTDNGGRIVYWSEPDGHIWEALTVSYARQRPGAAMDRPGK